MSYKIKISDALLRMVQQRKAEFEGESIEGRDIKSNQKKLNRIDFLLLKKDGVVNNKIAEKLNVSPDSISNWAKLFYTDGIDKLLSIELKGGKKSELDHYEKEIRKFITRNKREQVSIQEIQQFLEEQFSVSKTYNWLTRYCNKKQIPVKNIRRFIKCISFQYRSSKVMIRKVSNKRKPLLDGTSSKGLYLCVRSP